MRGFAIAAIVVASCAIGGACSSSSPSDSSFDGGPIASLPNCESVATGLTHDEEPSGSCTLSSSTSCIETACSASATYTCRCNGTWSCALTSGGIALSGCSGSEPEPVGDSGNDAASDANGDANLDASDDPDGDAS
ncbi:MAG: hypothetical protein ABI183_13975 [Polyangiaceae bacterium]